ncbi:MULTISPECIES: DUF3870 domain-containing protein [Pontibacillus]|uniref:DUF3870 domain-containing protein n=1 Tax=Pontibacillus chungwhensis TaxID=265426 RepID=A0ABY8UX94_9BACI|nr:MULTISPECIES: DUF3870 domain-containing protein [Pontibacillus]MCD5322852.1 DUF3870 domain-containing protein [Pontibacillus sp. HN14]WIF96251.1 DUF3870 domain-containing protein [Pontibacillus chungwhensis]
MKTYFIAGHARLPAGMAAQNMYDVLTITAEVDGTYGVILEANCTLATEHGRQFIGQLLKGFSLRHSLDEPIEEIRAYYLGKASNALISALKDLHKQYGLKHD